MVLGRICRQVMRCEKIITDSLLCILLTAMIALACLQIGLRTFLSTGLIWIDPLLRQLVLWCGLLGAVTATRMRKHISIDLIDYLIPEKGRPWIEVFIHAFASLTTATMTWASILFLRNEISFPEVSILGLPSWFWSTIYPVAFSLMTLHFLAAVRADIGVISRLPGEDAVPGEAR